ncbi:MAG: right-handed parallel beta-helix repeat-containing protein, partial [Phycisphaerae bacterium]|nr:right-handed parallel beta-helix repeat-containing protein [Phycisphaerae bacterium]
VVVEKCTICRNATQSKGAEFGGGGGIWILDAKDVTFDNCQIRDNSAALAGGGAIRMHVFDKGTMRNCVIAGNNAIDGGGVYFEGAREGLSITNCTFSSNTAVERGGAIYAVNGDLTLSNTILWGDKAATGPELHVMRKISIDHCDVEGGEAAVSRRGDSVINWGGNNMSIDPAFVDGGAGDYRIAGDSWCVDRGTNAPPGGLADEDLDGTSRLKDGNRDGNAVVDLGAYEAAAPDEVSISLSHFEIVVETVQGSGPVGAAFDICNAGPGLMNWSAQADLGGWGTLSSSAGQCAGTSSTVDVRFEDTARPVGTYVWQITVSSHEAVNSPRMLSVVLKVKVAEVRVPDDLATLQDAIDHVTEDGCVIVADGVYRGDGNRDLDFRGKNIIVRSENGPESCIIDCQGSQEEPHRAFYLHTGETRDSVIEGLTIINGHGREEALPLHYASRKGGAIRCDGASPTIVNCIFRSNHADSMGGAIHVANGSLARIDACVFEGNSSEWGGAVTCVDSAPGIIDCLLQDNTAGYGGAIWLERSSAEIAGCRILGNRADGGGGLLLRRSSPRITHCAINNNVAESRGGGAIAVEENGGIVSGCIFSGNSANGSNAGGGGAISGGHGDMIIEHCIIIENSGTKGGAVRAFYGTIVNSILAGNTASTYGGAIETGNARVINCTVVDNSAGRGGGIMGWDVAVINCIAWGNRPNQFEGSLQVTYSCVEGGWAGSGNIGVAPEFVSWENRDYHLRSEAGHFNGNGWVRDSVTSPCIDAGEPVSDWRGELWPHGDRINMGAYGGTSEASMSKSLIGNIADLNTDDRVDYDDFCALSGVWRCSSPLLKEDVNRDGYIDIEDVLIFADNWLWGAGHGAAIGHWPFDEGAGLLASDTSGNGRDGTLRNMDPGWIAGKAGGALAFDGVDDYVVIEDWKGIGGGRSRSCCAWIKTFDTAGEIISWGMPAAGARWNLVTEGNGRLRLEVGGGAIVGSTVVCDGQWHHVAAVLDNDGTPNVGEVRLYVDGAFDLPSSAGNQVVNTVTGATDSRDVMIGAGASTARYFEGVIDEVRIYDRALLAEEVAVLAGGAISSR